MVLGRFVALALIVSCGSAARGADAGDDPIEGTWLPTAAELGGKSFPDEVRKSIRLVVEGDRYTVTVGTVADRGTCTLDPSATPKSLDITGTEGPNKGRTILAIYERRGDTLRVCYDLGGKGRPSEFKTTEGSRLFLVEYKLHQP